MVQAYILIQAQTGTAAEVLRDLGPIDGVIEVSVITGPHDLIAHVQAETVDDLGKLVVSKIQSIQGIVRTLTSPVVNI